MTTRSRTFRACARVCGSICRERPSSAATRTFWPECSGRLRARRKGGAWSTVRDLGPGPSFVPAIQSIRVLTDDTCDDAQRFLTGEDYEGMLVTVDRVVITASQPREPASIVAIPGTFNSLSATRPRLDAAGPQDQILIASQGATSRSPRPRARS